MCEKTDQIEEKENETINNYVMWTVSEINGEIVKLLFGDDAVSVAPSEGYEWNAIIYRDWGGPREFAEFRTGGFYDYLVFKNRVLERLIKELKEELESTKKHIEYLDKRWGEVMKR